MREKRKRKGMSSERKQTWQWVCWRVEGGGGRGGGRGSYEYRHTISTYRTPKAKTLVTTCTLSLGVETMVL